MAERQKRRGRAAVEAARNVIFSAIIRNVRCAFGVAVIAEKGRLFIPEARLLDEQQVFALRGAGQKFFLGDGLGAGKVGVEEEQIVHFGQRCFLCQKDRKPLEGAVRPGVGFLVDAVYAGRVLVLDGGGVGENKVFFFAAREEFFREGAVKFRPEHRVLAGADVQHADFRHSAFPFRLSLAASFCA